MGIALAPISIHAQAAPAVVPTVPAGQQPTKEQLAKLFEVMHSKEQMASVMKMIPAIMQQQFAGQTKEMKKDHPEMASMTDEQQKAADKVMNRFMERAMTVYGTDEMVSDMSALYQKHLTSDDVDAMIAFYSSPAGQHMIATVPAIMQELLPTMMLRMQERLKPLIEDMAKEMAEIVKTPGSTLLVAPPPPTPAPK
jgi:hypothetical protein